MTRKKKNSIEKGGFFHKPIILLDVDDTLIDSSKVTIDLLNEKFEFTNRIKKLIKENKNIYEELKRWTYYEYFCGSEDGLRKEIEKESERIYESKEFWEKVSFNKYIDIMFDELGQSFKWIINSKGTKKNLEYKREWLIKHLPKEIEYELVLECINWGDKISKKHLRGDIIIDDRLDVLKNNNSPIKVLLKNFRKTDYNGGFGSSKRDFINEDIYEVNDIKEVIDLLKFFSQYKYTEYLL